MCVCVRACVCVPVGILSKRNEGLTGLWLFVFFSPLFLYFFLLLLMLMFEEIRILD